jgi:putative Holliday junction resolvase
VQRALGLGHCAFGLLELLGFDLPVDFTLLQIADECARFTSQSFRFSLQKTDSIRDTLCVTGFLRPYDHGRKKGHEQEQRCESAQWHSCWEAVRELYRVGRIAGLDVGERRIGVAISDATGTLARPVGVVRTSGLDGDALDRAAAEIARLSDEEDGVSALVVGLPRRLDGSANDMTPRVEAFAQTLGRRTSLPIVLQDERLTSVEAESRLATRDKDWRARKARLDAAAAAIILQDYLDSRPHPAVAEGLIES